MAIWGVIACSIISISFVAGLPWGATGVALSYAIVTTMLVHPQLAVATVQSPNKRRFA